MRLIKSLQQILLILLVFVPAGAIAGAEVLIVTDPSNMAWLTGYDGWSFYVHQAVVLPLQDRPYWWGRRQDANGALRTVNTDRTGIDS